MNETTAVVGSQWTPKTLEEACARLSQLRDENRALKRDLIAAHEARISLIKRVHEALQ